MSYTKTQWVNDQAPAINDTNLNKIEQGIYDNDSHIGDLSDLETTANTDLVSAINEVDSHADTNATNIGDLTTLTTTAKSNVVSAINEVDGKVLGINKMVTEENKYLKIATIEFDNNWKASNMFFTLTNTQNDSYLQLVNLYCHKTDTGVEVSHFSTISLKGDIKQNLVAIVTATNKIELYFKNFVADSTALNIIAEPKQYCSITIDMDTIVTTLPSGTATYVADTKVGNSTLWNGWENDLNTYDGINTWIPVLVNGALKHTTIESIVDRGLLPQQVQTTDYYNCAVACYKIGKLCIVSIVCSGSQFTQQWTDYILAEISGVTAKAEMYSTFSDQQGRTGDMYILQNSNQIRVNYRGATPDPNNAWFRGQLVFVTN